MGFPSFVPGSKAKSEASNLAINRLYPAYTFYDTIVSVRWLFLPERRYLFFIVFRQNNESKRTQGDLKRRETVDLACRWKFQLKTIDARFLFQLLILALLVKLHESNTH